jgi:hypothetical protein
MGGRGVELFVHVRCAEAAMSNERQLASRDVVDSKTIHPLAGSSARPLSASAASGSCQSRSRRG